MNVGIYLYENAEVLDFSGPFEVFTTANRLVEDDLFNVFLIAEDRLPVHARGGFTVYPFFDLNDHPNIDVLIVAGGVHTSEVNKPAVVDWVMRMAQGARIVASVCTGAFILAEAGLLNGLRATTHWEDISDLRETYPDVEVLDSVRWIDEGKIVTSGGISAGIDMSLHLVERLADDALARKTARQMEFDWQKKGLSPT